MKGRIAFFDVDGPLVNGYCNTEFFRVLAEKGVFPKKEWAAAQKITADFRAGRISYVQSSPLYIGALAAGLEGKKETEILKEARRFLPHFKKILRPYASELLSLLKPHFTLVSVSASNREVAGLMEAFGMDYTIASAYEVRDGIYTGGVSFPVISPREKLDAVNEFASERGIELGKCIAFGDSPSDEMMLDAVGKAFALMPNAELHELIAKKGKKWVEIVREGDAVAIIRKELGF
ncbi:haloacid dehalogenase-like hydrolase [Candidatus Micrarchaeota archaeon]|nr:haloacid dehalogenase-like hydrolase [Candidatus Micrarchaeota archaeon]